MPFNGTIAEDGCHITGDRVIYFPIVARYGNKASSPIEPALAVYKNVQNAYLFQPSDVVSFSLVLVIFIELFYRY
jgi:hypothetical protein